LFKALLWRQQASSFKPQASSLKLQASSCKPQAASLKLQASSCKPQAARSFKPQASSFKPQASSFRKLQVALALRLAKGATNYHKPFVSVCIRLKPSDG